MALFRKLTATLGGAALAFTLPMFATANQGADVIEATHFVSSGRVVNLVADVTPGAQADARAAIWALTQDTNSASCDDTAAADASCFGTFRTGSN